MSTPPPPPALLLRCPLFFLFQNIEKARERRTFETMAGSSETGVPDDLLAHSEVTTLTLCPRNGGGGMGSYDNTGGVFTFFCIPLFFVEPFAGSSETGAPDDLLAHSEVTTLTLCSPRGCDSTRGVFLPAPEIVLVCPSFVIETLAGSSETGVPDGELLACSELTHPVR